MSVRRQILAICLIGALGLIGLSIILVEGSGRLVVGIDRVNDIMLISDEEATISNLIGRARRVQLRYHNDPRNNDVEQFETLLLIARTKAQGVASVALDGAVRRAFAVIADDIAAYGRAMNLYRETVDDMAPQDDAARAWAFLDSRYAALSERFFDLRGVLRHKAESQIGVTSRAQDEYMRLALFGTLAVLVAVGSLTLFIGHNVSSRLRSLMTTLDRLVEGDSDVAIPLLDDRAEIGAIARFLSEYRAQSEALRQSEQRHQTAQRMGRIGHWTWEAAGRQFMWSNQTYRIFGCERGRFVPTAGHILDLIHPRDGQILRDWVDQAWARAVPLVADLRLLPVDGIDRWIHMQGAATTDDDGRIVSYAGTIQDITDRKRSEEALRQARDELDQRVRERTQHLSREIRIRAHTEDALIRAKEQAEAANRAKSEFLANMSHELRTPLNAILGFAEAMASGVLGRVHNEKHVEYLNDIQASGEHLLSLINDVLDVSAIEAGKMDLQEEWCDLNEIAESSLRIIRARAEKKALAVTSTVRIGSSQAYLDGLRMKQILINLLTNAVKFTEACGRIGLTMEIASDDRLRISVDDSGIGMSEVDIEKALLPFQQVDSSQGRNFEGTGLGLPLSKSLVELHGGEMLIHSRPGEGTSVELLFPADRLRPDDLTLSDAEVQYG